jgi:hypothetical protein
MPEDNFNYGTTDLIGVVEPLRANQAPNFLLNMFFPNVLTFETETIKFDRVAEDLRIAEFASPTAKAKARSRKGFEVTTFDPAYVKELDQLTPSELRVRLPGEPLNGRLSNHERALAHIGNILGLQRNRIRRLLEVMASKIVLDMAITIEGEDYPSRHLDFGRSPEMKKSLVGSRQWGEADVDAFDDLDGWLDDFGEINGSAATDVIVTGDTWKYLNQSKKFRDALDRDLGQTALIDLGFTALTPGAPTFKGRIGNVSFWVYNALYHDKSGDVRKMLPPYTLIIGSRAVVDGCECYGHIEDFDADNVALDIFSKTWTSKEPSVLSALSQTAPLLVPKRSNGTMVVTVRQE